MFSNALITHLKIITPLNLTGCTNCSGVNFNQTLPVI
uniref:Uncharacterized protein n=1 Tax=Anguilla anguilla TaxID=7936 RepID=A0A0E9QB02_ANGAN